MTCVEQCPVEAFPDVSSTCRPCNSSCLQFTRERYIITISEGSESGSSVVTVAVVDSRQLDRPVQFAITSGNSGREFGINSTSGVITLASVLDRESQDAHTFTIAAFDVGIDQVSSQSATAIVLVLVDDVNDNPPVFTEEQYTASVLENQPAGVSLVTVMATDADIPPNTMVTYSLGDSTDLFQLDPTSGVINTTVLFDFEAQQSYLLTVVASDSGTPSLASSAEVLISVFDVNDVRPTFLQTEYSIAVSEGIPTGSSLVQLQAMDVDTSNLTYELTGGNAGGEFQLDVRSGLLTSATTLDFEDIREYLLTVVVSDGLPNLLPSGTATVTISVLDENDHAPSFNQSLYTAAIPENVPPDTFVLVVPARDLDSGNNSVISYSITAGDSEAFYIDNAGAIFTLSSPNRERQSLYELTITATDQGIPTLSGTAPVMIFIDDLNDNTPLFTETQVIVNLTETTPVDSVITTFQASDADTGTNADIQYQFVNLTTIPFSIDKTSGVVTLNQLLDFEQIGEYVLLVTASDQGFPRLTSNASLFVYVSDINDNLPVFAEDQYDVIIFEDVDVGSSILLVSATDADSGTNGAVTYQIVAGNQEGVFSIDPDTGMLSLVSSLDFERQSLYNISVSASNFQSDIPLASMVSVIITVAEVNEHSPSFSEDLYEASLPENEPSGTSIVQLVASDSDSGTSGQITFDILEEGPFEISVDGLVVTALPLDREQRESYTLTVRARDGGTPSLTGTTTVQITVLDLNDNPPRFSITTPYVASVIENAPQGTVIVTTPPFSAADADSIGPNSDVTYRIVDGDPDGIFTINPLTGLLQSTGDIDYETVRQYELIISATDNGTPSLSSSATVQVEIIDANDNAPLISNTSTQAVFIEGQGQLLLSPGIVISDADSLPLRQITVSLSGLPPDTLTITNPPPNSQLDNQLLELSGSFTPEEATILLRTLTFANGEDEPISDSRMVNIGVSDGTFTDGISIEVMIQLINDKRPQVDLNAASSPGSGYETVFVEEGPPVAVTGPTVTVSDADSEAAGLQSLTIELLEPQDGILEGIRVSTHSDLNVQYGQDNHTISVTAREEEAPFASLESLLLTLVYFSDADEPRAPLERRVRVVASDGSLESEPAISTVSILLVNDPPLLDLGGNVDHQVEFVEGFGPVLLVSLTAFSLTDSDSTHLQNATVMLLLAPDGENEALAINISTAGLNITITRTNHSLLLNGPAPLGEFAAILTSITYNNILASPADEQRQVEFRVSDGLAVAIATTFVTFSLVNDPPIVDVNGPQQGSNFTTVFLEGSPPIQITSLQLAIRDVDSLSLSFALIQLSGVTDNDTESISIVSSNTTLQVSTSPSLISLEGIATLEHYSMLLRSLTYANNAEEPTPGLRLVTFTVSDGEANSSPVTTTISVESVNDVPELILNGGEVYPVNYVEQSAPVGIVNPVGISLRDNDNISLDHLLVTVHNVLDGDAEILGYSDPSLDQSLDVIAEFNGQRQTYTLSFSQESSSFENYQSLVSSLTYHNTALEPTAALREFEFSIDDGIDASLPQHSTVNITLLNDNVPRFLQFFFQASVLENRVNITVTTVIATDEDSSSGPFAAHGTIQYSITSGDNGGNFAIDANTGVITLVRPKDRETSTAGAVLTVQARNPVPPDNQFATAFVFVSVLDENDNSPRFLGLPYDLQVLEHTDRGVVIGTVQATDADVGDNGIIAYEISQGNVNSVFEIDASSGNITVANSLLLDRETTPGYSLSITASDRGQPSISNTTTVTIALLDINDNPPVFSDTTYTGVLSEFTAIGTSLLMVSASDSDTDSNIVYTIEGTSSFAINSTTGEIITSASLNREAQSFHNFTVVASDGELSGTALVTVGILDENDHTPVFVQPFYNSTIPENFLPGRPVLVVAALDQDSGTNANVFYSINGSTPFVVDPSSGVISLEESLDRETESLYVFLVLAKDGGLPPMQSGVPVTIVISDVNDNTPMFSQLVYETSLVENVRLLQSVATVSATDADSGGNGEIVYSIVGGGVFQVDPQTGEVFTVSDIDREEQDYYQVEITAVDQGNPPLSSRATLSVNITDLNDNAPVFSSLEYQFSIIENTAAGPFGSVSASDVDLGSNAQITYSLSSDFFTVHEITGQLSTQLPLDREAIPSYSLTVVARDNGQPSLSSNTTVLVTVQDVNDFSPEFSEVLYNVTIPEDQSNESVLPTVVAVDFDSGSNAQVVYQLLSGGTGVFLIDPQTGQLRLASPLDAEGINFYSLTIEACDSGVPRLSSTTTVTVTVTDINDNPIEFLLDESVAAVYVEEGPPVSIAPSILIQDVDITAVVQNVTVELVGEGEDRLLLPPDITGLALQLMNNDQVLIIQGPANASLVSLALQTVQYENTNPEPQGRSLEAHLTASDGLFTASAVVTIAVTLVNDHSPVVLLDGDNLNNSLTFTENDPSVGIAGDVMISDGDSDALRLDSITVTLLTSPDDTQEFLTAESNSFVSVFPASGLVIQLNGPALFTDFVTALSSVRYQNLADDPQFPLTRTIEVIASDGLLLSSPSYSIVTIIPVNDPPVLQLGINSINYTTVFTEGGEAVSLVFSGSVLSDPDSDTLTEATITVLNTADIGSEQILFQSSNSSLTFMPLSLTSLHLIGPATPNDFISAFQSLSYLNNATSPTAGARLVRFTIHDGEITATAFSEVVVETINNAPTIDFNGPQPGLGFQTNFLEGGPPVAIASEQVVIADTDNLLLSSLTIAILSSTDRTAETLSVGGTVGNISSVYTPATGTMFLSGPATTEDYRTSLLSVQYQNTADEPSGNQRDIQVIVSDGDLTSEPAIVVMTFIFVNDPPVVVLDTGGDFSTVYIENNPQVSIVNPRSAEITDPDSPTLAYLLIQVANVLDGELELLNYSSPVDGLLEEVGENTVAQTSYYNLSYATPMPVDVYSDLLLSLSYRNLADEPNDTLPRVFRISTSDGEVSSAVAIATVSISLIDDNQPQFEQDVYNFSISEDANLDVTVGMVLAMDADIGDTFLYQLSLSDSPFTIDGVSGAITITESLDKEAESEYRLDILLSRDTQPFSLFDSQAVVTISVLDINDNVPMFNQTSFSLQVPEDTPSGTIVTTVTAQDADEGTNSDIMYSLNGTAVFSIDSLTGVLVTLDELDRESVPLIEFVVMATDGGQPPLFSQVEVIVIVNDVNDNTPQFSQPSYFTQLVETVPPGTSILQLSASDQDDGLNAEIDFSLSPESSQFSVNSSSGVVTVSSTLAPAVHYFTVMAIDRGQPPLTSAVNVTIDVISFNSTLPLFSQPSYEGTIIENSPSGTTILTVTAIDPISNDPLSYTITVESPMFVLDSTSGILSANMSLDRETRDIYQFQVGATSADGIREGFAQVVVRVLDANDFSPQFTQLSYSFQIEEDVLIGATVGDVFALDLMDAGSNAQIVSYGLSSTNFSISSSGIITTNSQLDRESQDIHDFQVLATDGGSPPQTGSSMVTVRVLDQNDITPVFSQMTYNASIAEGFPIGSSVLTVVASDQDEGPSGQVSYLTNSSVFAVDPQDGEVSTLVILDFEDLPVHEVVVEALDGGQPQLSSSTVVRITVIDIDDTPPQFAMDAYSTSVAEEMGPVSVVSVQAFDSDSGPGNPIVYDIVDGNSESLFAIGQNGNISTLAALDRENVSQHILTIQASNLDAVGSTLSSFTTVLIVVLDINDNAPQFLRVPYVFSIAENTSDGEILDTLTVTDADEGINARISTFSILSGDPNDNFEIGPQSGTLRVSDSAILDRESQEEYFLVVQVTDGGTPPLSTNTTVSVRLTDINDNAPMFSQDVYNISVREDSPVGSTILTVIASDSDLDASADITFSILELTQVFAIDPMNGVITLITSLDFESQTLYSLTILAVDGGSPQLTSSVTLHVAVTDADDLPVVFEPDTYSVSVFENTPSGTTVATVTAQDPDTVVSNPITYSLAQGELVPFSVDGQSGDILVFGALDREVTDRYVFSVLASNTPGVSATATITVQVQDVNDVIPVFPSGPFQFQISESDPIGTTLGQVTAVDGDLSLAGTVVEYTFEITVAEFAINATSGVITLASDGIDFETIQEYNLTILARDGGTPSLTGTSTVTIAILDANDNAPEFPMDSFSTAVPEDEPVGSIILTVTATDADGGVNALVVYSLSALGVPFAIDPPTGMVNTTAPLALGTYDLQITATDMGVPALSSTATLTVIVTDANERPSFTESSYVLELAESTPVGPSVLQVQALDPDTGNNANISYSIEPADIFTIAADTGIISLAQSLDFEQDSAYTRTLIATDSGTPPLSTSVSLSVTVLDSNDNAPQFSAGSYSTSVPESTAPGSSLLTVSASDADSSTNAAIIYSLLQDGGGSFTINPTTGTISTLQALDFESQQSVELVAQARDGGEPLMSTAVSVTIFITDIDDNPPVFDQDLYTTAIVEDSSPGTFVLTVRATDSDSGTNAVINYSITNSSGPFFVDPTLGNISLASPGLDREATQEYMFIIEASNPHSSLFSAITLVRVTVLDTNDNAPQFDPGTLSFTISESVPVGTTIGTVTAADNDMGSNSIVRYSIDLELITIDSDTGELTVAQSLDYEASPVIELAVVAIDSGVPPLSTNATLTVQLVNVNDIPPQVSSPPDLLTFQEGSGMIGIGTGIGISDPDNLPLTSASVKLYSDGGMGVAPPGDFILLDRSTSESQGLTLFASTTCINITGSASVQSYVATLSQLQFGSTAQEPVAGTRQVQVQVSDGEFNSNVAIVTILVQLVNDNPPVLDLSVGTEGLGYQTVFTEGGLFVFVVGQDASLSDPDGSDIQSVAITIINPLDGALEQLSAFTVVRGVSVETINSSAIVLVGPAQPDDFELVLQTVSYVNLADEPQEVQTARLIAFEASDGVFTSQAVFSTVVIQPVNDPPEVRLGITQDIVLVYSEEDVSLKLVSDDFLLSDDDSDLLSFVNVTAVNFQPGIDRFNYSTEGTNVTAEFLSGTLLFTGPASIEEFTSVLQTLMYINTFVERDEFDQLTGGQTIQFTASDGSLTSATTSAFITFSGVNDRPLVDLNGMELGQDFTSTFQEGDTMVTVASSQLTIMDDSEFLVSAVAQLTGTLDLGEEFLRAIGIPDPLTFSFDSSTQVLTLTGSGTVAQYEASLRLLTYQNTAPEPTPGPRTVQITISDGETVSVPVTSTILVIAINDPPILSFLPAGIPFTEGGSPVPLVDTNSITLMDRDNTMLSFLEATILNAVDGATEEINISSSLEGLTLSLQSTPEGTTFRFSFSPSSEGTIQNYITLLSSLSYDNVASEPSGDTRNINITVSDGTTVSEPEAIFLEISLVNDNVPMFAEESVQVETSEDTVIGSAIFRASATDLDTDSIIAYALTSDQFSVNESTGVITLIQNLDREIQNTHNLVVMAADGLNTSELQLEVVVLDENDNPPVFAEGVYQTIIREDISVGSSVVQVTASDRDQGTNSAITYSIRGGNTEGVFSINGSSGVIRTVAALDFETTSAYNLIVLARDDGIPVLSSESTIVVVSVMDVNDNPPVFTPSTVVVPTSEDQPIDSVIYTASAMDEDAISQVTYTLMTDTDMFDITSVSGEVILREPLDRETSASLTLIVLATDGELNSTLLLIVMVTDIDDNPPLFTPDTYSLTLPENITIGTTVLQLVTFDPDVGTNAAAQYEIISGDPNGRFDVVAATVNTSELVVVRELDRENQGRFELTVVARSPLNPTLNDTAAVEIVISDVNDSPPEFDLQLYQFALFENATIGTVLGSVRATDADSGSNGEVTYEIFSTSPSGDFDITPSGDLILMQLLDRENFSQYDLIILANDGGSPILEATTAVEVTVLDVNDNPPVFEQLDISFNLPENSPPDSSITTLTAVDNDEGTNAEISYSLHPDNTSLFAINSDSGLLTARVSFDFENSPSNLLILVTATDNGFPLLSSDVHVFITLLDVNEFTPEFEATEYTIEISEGVQPFTTILQVNATDLDGGIAGIVYYSLLAMQPFAVSNTTGEIYTTSSLDRENVASYQLTVQASNALVSPSLPSTAIINILLLDSNDNPPIFIQEEFTAAILISADVGTEILTVVANDPDVGTNAEVRYTISDPGGHFAISDTDGTISLQVPLNFTTDFILTVFAADRGTPQLMDNATVTITVTEAVGVQFSQEGVGFLLQGVAGATTHEFGLFADGPVGDSGIISATLGNVSVEMPYSSELPEAIGVRGVVLTGEVWPDQSDVRVVVQVYGEGGEVHCSPSEVVIRVVPDEVLRNIADLTPQVSTAAISRDH